MKNKHPQHSVRPELECKICGIEFRTESDLMKHMPHHFKCCECSIPFEDLRSLNRHKKTYHSELECEVCSTKCVDKGFYDIHMKEHLKCEICAKVFDKLYKLNRHIVTHK